MVEGQNCLGPLSDVRGKKSHGYMKEALASTPVAEGILVA